MRQSPEWRSARRRVGSALEGWQPSTRAWLILPLVGAAAAVWIRELRYVDVSRTGDLGLAALLPVPALLALLGLAITFCLVVHLTSTPQWLLAVILTTILVLAFGVSAMVESEARFPVAWRFIGLTDYVLRHGSLNTNLDFYFSYPGFLILLASLTGVSGLQNLLAVANWTSVFFTLMYLPPLYLILSSLSADSRVVWLGLGLFAVGDWVGQDYLAPQALAYFLFLLLLGILLRWFTRQGSEAMPALATRQRVALLVVFLLLFASILVMHPLTPVLTVMAVGLLVVLRRAGPWWLPVVMALMAAAWTFFMTSSFIAYHTSFVTGDVGHVGSNVNQNVSNRVIGSPGHLFIVKLRLVMAAAVGGLAALGLLRSWRRHAVDLRALLLMVSPFPLIVFQAYGGELGLRIYLFALPFVAFYAARAFYPSPSSRSPWMAGATMVTVVALLLGFLFAKYGNERQDYATPQEVAAAQYLYAVAPAGSLLLSPNGNRPSQYTTIEQYDVKSLDPTVIDQRDLGAIESQMLKQPKGKSFLIISRSEKAYSDMSSGLPLGAVDGLQAALESSPDFRVLYRNPDAEILVLNPSKPQSGHA